MYTKRLLVLVFPFLALNAGCFGNGGCTPSGYLEVDGSAAVSGSRLAAASGTTSDQFGDDNGVFQSDGFTLVFDSIGADTGIVDLGPIATVWAGQRGTFTSIQGNELPSTIQLGGALIDNYTEVQVFTAMLTCTVATQEKPKPINGKDSQGQWTSQTFLALDCAGTDISSTTLSVTASFVYSAVQDQPCCGPQGSPQNTDCGI